jgi:signal transduction histidine kinase
LTATLPSEWQRCPPIQSPDNTACWLAEPAAWALAIGPGERLVPAAVAQVPLVAAAPQIEIGPDLWGQALLCWRCPPAAPPALAWLTAVGRWIGAALAHHACAAELQRTQNEIATLKATLDVRNTRWSALHNTVVLLTQQLDDEHVLEEIVRRSIQLLEADRGALVERHPSADGLLITMAFWRDGRPDVAHGKRIAVGEGLSGRVFQAGQPMMVANYSRWPEQVAGVDGAAMGAAAAVPLFGRQGIIGVLGVASTAEDKRFTEDDVQILTLFAHQAAAVLEHTYARRQAEALILSQERGRLARDLHDGLLQDLASLLMRADLCQELAEVESGSLHENLEILSMELQRSIRNARAIIHALWEPELEGRSLEDALGFLAARFEAQTHVRVDYSCRGEAGAEGGWLLSKQCKWALLRLTQEALNNIRQHAAATKVSIELERRRDGEMRLSVRDDGRGFEPAAVRQASDDSQPRHFGLWFMRERIEACGGSFGVEAAPGRGTTIWAVLPSAEGAS